MTPQPITPAAPSFGQFIFDLLAQDRMLGRNRVEPDGDACPMCDGTTNEGFCRSCNESVL